MQRIIAYSIVATALMVGTTHAKRNADVKKALEEAYPGAKTELLGNQDINGVRVSTVKVTTKEGDSEAQVTSYGDFLSYGVPHGSVAGKINRSLEGLFKSKPDDVEMYRVTNYYIDLAGPNNKQYRAIFDAVGRLTDIQNAAEMQREQPGGTLVRGEPADKAAAFAKRYMPDAEFTAVYQSDAGPNFYDVPAKNGLITVNTEGQVFQIREDVAKDDIPKPILDSVDRLFGAEKIQKAQRGEFEYYQFDQKTPTGEPVVVKMRPNGDIIEVENDKARQEEQAVTAKHKEQSGKADSKSGKKG